MRMRRMERRLAPEHRRTAAMVAACHAGLALLWAASLWAAAAGRIGWAPAWPGLVVPPLAALLLETLFVRFLRSERERREEQERIGKERAETEAAFRDIRAQRHDFLAHAGALHHMLEENRMAEAREYLGRLLDDYGRINLSIRGEKAHIAALLIRTRQRAEAAGIRFALDLGRPLSDLPLPPTEQSKLVSNILNNALEAAEASGLAEPWVKVASLAGGGLYVLEASNSTAPLPPGIADRLFRSYGLSTKGDRRGIGTYIIASIVETNGGVLEYSAVGDRFQLKIKLPIIA
mgnify:CR=1 FL=1